MAGPVSLTEWRVSECRVPPHARRRGALSSRRVFRGPHFAPVWLESAEDEDRLLVRRRGSGLWRFLLSKRGEYVSICENLVPIIKLLD